MLKRISVFLLCAVMTVSGCALSVSATQEPYEEETFILRYTYTNKISASLSIRNGKASLSGYVDGISSVTKIEYTVYLQEKNGRSWTDVDSWSGSSSSTRATYSYSSSAITSGKTYRTETVATVYSGSKSEVVSVYSTEKTV